MGPAVQQGSPEAVSIARYRNIAELLRGSIDVNSFGRTVKAHEIISLEEVNHE